jgi:hypothetical protein
MDINASKAFLTICIVGAVFGALGYLLTRLF